LSRNCIVKHVEGKTRRRWREDDEENVSNYRMF
jgi:hypothetical protein